MLENDIVDDVVTVRWYTPTSMSKQRTKAWHQMNYEKELVAVAQAGGRQYGPVSLSIFFFFFAINAIFISCFKVVRFECFVEINSKGIEWMRG